MTQQDLELVLLEVDRFMDKAKELLRCTHSADNCKIETHYEEFKEAWEKCVKENKNLCEKSTNICSECIELKKLQHKDQEVIFYNKCSFNCDLTSWEIKDEGRKRFIFPKFILQSGKEIKIKVGIGENNEERLFWKDETYVWTKSGDTLFLRDSKEKLVLWQNY